MIFIVGTVHHEPSFCGFWASKNPRLNFYISGIVKLWESPRHSRGFTYN
jgi:hypothetical protein